MANRVRKARNRKTAPGEPVVLTTPTLKIAERRRLVAQLWTYNNARPEAIADALNAQREKLEKAAIEQAVDAKASIRPVKRPPYTAAVVRADLKYLAEQAHREAVEIHGAERQRVGAQFDRLLAEYVPRALSSGPRRDGEGNAIPARTGDLEAARLALAVQQAKIKFHGFDLDEAREGERQMSFFVRAFSKAAELFFANDPRRGAEFVRLFQRLAAGGEEALQESPHGNVVDVSALPAPGGRG